MKLKTAANINLCCIALFEAIMLPFNLLKRVIDLLIIDPFTWLAMTTGNKLLLCSDEVKENKIKNKDALNYGAYQVYQLYKKEQL